MVGAFSLDPLLNAIQDERTTEGRFPRLRMADRARTCARYLEVFPRGNRTVWQRAFVLAEQHARALSRPAFPGHQEPGRLFGKQVMRVTGSVPAKELFGGTLTCASSSSKPWIADHSGVILLRHYQAPEPMCRFQGRRLFLRANCRTRFNTEFISSCYVRNAGLTASCYICLVDLLGP
jgi:hypothetical protein